MKAQSYKAQKVIERLGKKLNRAIVGSMVACVHCGMCTESCHYVLANPGDPTYAPAYKADRIRKLFKRHFDWTGRVFPWWVKAGSVYTDEDLEELKDFVFGRCTNCRRCSLNCPMGVDLATFNRMARGLLVHLGIMPEGVAVVCCPRTTWRRWSGCPRNWWTRSGIPRRPFPSTKKAPTSCTPSTPARLNTTRAP
jgi:ferredoxin